MTWTAERIRRHGNVIDLAAERKRREEIDERRAERDLYSSRARAIHAQPRSVQHSFLMAPGDDAA